MKIFVKFAAAAALSALILTSLTSCSGIIESTVEFQKNMHQAGYYRLNTVCETDDGYYILEGGSDAYFIDKATHKISLLCTKPECAHNDDTCNAQIYGGVLWESGGRLYYTNSTLLEEHGRLVDHGERIYSTALDGTDRRVVQDLEFEPSGSSTYVDPILHRGYVYFFYSGMFYRVPLGGKLKKRAEALWGDEIEGEKGNLQVYDKIPVGHNFTLWADGDFVYFMANVMQSDGTYKDTLFAYDTAAAEEKDKDEGDDEPLVKQVWEVPDGDVVGEWTETGVSVTQWYVKGGYIYFYLSGGDFWRCRLETEEFEKLADTKERTEYGKAIFSDEYLCLLNSVPEDNSLPGFEVVGDRYDYLHLVGGDTFYVYGLDGEFVRELPLSALYGDVDGIVNVEPIFCSGGEIYFVAEAETVIDSDPAGENGYFQFGGKKKYDYILCCVNIETGEIIQLIDWERV